MRGKVGEDEPDVDVIGITPAHAGKRRTRLSGAGKGQDHPRTCGEKNGGIFKALGKEGSPPHMRGKD